MNEVVCLLLAVLSIWDYPARQFRHARLSAQFKAAVREGDTETMRETCEKGVKLLPDDPTWRYNLACSLAYYADPSNALECLEQAIDLGFRDAETIGKDSDLQRLAKNPRFGELVEYARAMQSKPILSGPMANVPATGVSGSTIVLGEQNLAWDFDAGCFVARMKLANATAGGNTGDLYMNRDGGHSALNTAEFPGLTRVVLDSAGKSRMLDTNLPNMLCPYPLFGNASRAYVQGSYWRSLPRALMTTESAKLGALVRMYTSNQVWVFPVNADFPPVGTHGDVFAAVTPYCIATQGASWSDQYYLKAALEISRSLDPVVKREIVKRGLLAPTVQALLRHSLHGVTDECHYLSGLAHPTCFPPNGLDFGRMKAAAAAMKVSEVPPVASLSVRMKPPEKYDGPASEVVFASRCACSFVLRADQKERNFIVRATGGEKFAFVQVHGDTGALRIENLTPNTAKVTVRRECVTVTDRVDLAVFAKAGESDWGAPSFVSFAVVDPEAPYSDPYLTPRGDSPAKKPEPGAQKAPAPAKPAE